MHQVAKRGVKNENNKQTILWYNSISRARVSPGGGTRSIGMNRARTRS